MKNASTPQADGIRKTTDSNTASAGRIQKVLPTADAASALNRRPQTLHKWAFLDCGPLCPVRVNGRLAWRVEDIERLLNGGEQ